jgi:hypothetical protein
MPGCAALRVMGFGAQPPAFHVEPGRLGSGLEDAALGGNVTRTCQLVISSRRQPELQVTALGAPAGATRRSTHASSTQQFQFVRSELPQIRDSKRPPAIDRIISQEMCCGSRPVQGLDSKPRCMPCADPRQGHWPRCSRRSAESCLEAGLRRMAEVRPIEL